jgi:hypothetical protein
MCQFGSKKLFWFSIIAHLPTVAGKRRSNAVHLQKRV